MHDPNLILQPAGHNNPQTWSNFVHTILTPVPIETIRNYAGDQVADALLAIYPSGSVPTWGLKPNNYKKVWSRIQIGDSVLFVGDKKAFMSGTISFEPLHNRELAVALWGLDNKDGQTAWEYVYFVDDLHDQNMPYSNLSRLIGYGERNNFMSATILDYEQSKAVFETLDLESDTYIPPSSSNKPYKINPNISLVADYETTNMARGEQKLLRNILFFGKTYELCGICLKEYPVRLLVTAHIKKRKACSDEEKLDLYNIAMPMCAFGCDILYERGYIGVDITSKKVIIADDLNLPKAVHNYLVSVEGNNCSWVNDRTSAYFEYHNQQMVHPL